MKSQLEYDVYNVPQLFICVLIVITEYTCTMPFHKREAWVNTHFTPIPPTCTLDNSENSTFKIIRMLSCFLYIILIMCAILYAETWPLRTPKIRKFWNCYQWWKTYTCNMWWYEVFKFWYNASSLGRFDLDDCCAVCQILFLCWWLQYPISHQFWILAQQHQQGFSVFIHYTNFCLDLLWMDNRRNFRSQWKGIYMCMCIYVHVYTLPLHIPLHCTCAYILCDRICKRGLIHASNF